MNPELERFVKTQTNIDISRSTFSLNHGHKMTFKSGDLVPVDCIEVLPGDTFSINTSFVTRMITPVVPVMDNAFLDYFWFFVPTRIIAPFNGDDWEEIQGANKSGFWAQETEKVVTKRALGNGNCLAGSVANYLGLPINASNGFTLSINPYPLIGYVLIWDNWFRDENVQSPLLTSGTDISSVIGQLNDSCLKVNKFHDLFTSCLPSPQKGPSVTLPLGDNAPVFAGNDNPNLTLVNRGKPLHFATVDGNKNVDQRLASLAGNLNGVGSSTPSDFPLNPAYPSNLYADLSNATASTVNQLRQAFAIQRCFEKDARGGTRFKEILKAHWNIDYPDMTLQRPEYLAGKRVPIVVTQVLQTAPTNDTSPLGFTGAFSNTVDSDGSFTKSFGEHGFLYCLACVRPMQSYSQGVPKMFQRSRRFDYYMPVFANLGEQAILKNELVYFSDSVDTDLENTSVFGYNEAWAHYRYLPSLISGELAPNAKNNTFTPWTFTNDFGENQPVLNSTFITQSSSNIGRTLVSTTSDYQFIADWYFETRATRAMPLYSIPGLIDHH